MSYDTAKPYVASYLIVKKDEKIAFVLRSNTGWMNGYYGLPSGKVEKNETFTQAAIREAREEIGIEVVPEGLRYVHTSHRSEGDEWVDIFYEVTKWKGDVVNAEPHMHSELAWFDPQNLPKNIIPSLAFALSQIFEGKQYSEYGW